MSTAPSSKEFKFYVNPRESLEEREIRWDKWMSELETEGLTVQGTGPDGDYPIRYSFGQEDELTFDQWWKGNPDEPFFEVYRIVPLPAPDAPPEKEVDILREITVRAVPTIAFALLPLAHGGLA